MSVPNPYLFPAEWGRVLVGGSVLPGVLTSITVGSRKYVFTKQKGYGLTEVTIYSTTEAIDGIAVEHFIRPNVGDALGDFEELRDKFMPTLIKGWPNQLAGKPLAFPFDHPMAQWVGLKRAHLTEVSPPYTKIENDPSYWYRLVFQEDIKQTILKPGPAEPAKINGPPTPKDAFEATLLQGLAAFTGKPVAQVSAPPNPPLATASGSVN